MGFSLVGALVTSETSTTLLLIVTQFVAQIVAALLSNLINQRPASRPESSPETVQVQGLPSPKEGWLRRLLNSPWVPLSFIVLDVWWLIHDSRSHALITRLDVYNIATMTAAIFFNALWMSLNVLRQQFRKQDATVIAGFRNVGEGINRFKELVQEGLVPKSELEKLRSELGNLRDGLEKLAQKRTKKQRLG